jgi:hypothetical protein
MRWILLVAVLGGCDAAPDGAGDAEPAPTQLAFYKGGSRIKMRVGTTADGAKLLLGWRDTQRNDDCDFSSRAADGKYRCLPPGHVTSGGYFADANCSQMVVGTEKASLCDGPPPARHAYARVPLGCAGGGFRVFRMGAAHQGKVYAKTGAGCLEMDLSAIQDFFVAGDEVAPSQFQEMSESIE